MAVVLFGLTAAPMGSFTGLIGKSVVGQTRTTDGGGNDPWTGEYRPMTQTYTDNATGERVTKPWGTSAYKNVRAIPMPVGFAVGCLLTVGLIAALRRRKTPPTPAASIA